MWVLEFMKTLFVSARRALLMLMMKASSLRSTALVVVTVYGDTVNRHSAQKFNVIPIQWESLCIRIQ